MMNTMQWEWTRPGMLAWLLMAIPILVWFHFRSLSDFPHVQRVSLALRMAIVCLITLALADLVLLVSTSRQMIVVAIDTSESIDDAAKLKANEFIESLKLAAAKSSDTELRYLQFDRTPGMSVEQWPDETTQANQPQADTPKAADQSPNKKTSTDEEPLGTDIAAAIRTAVASIPPSYVPSVIVVSDGNSTTDDAVAAAASAGVPISTVPLPQRSSPEVQVAQIVAPAQVRQGEPFFIEVVINSNRDASGFVGYTAATSRSATRHKSLWKSKRARPSFAFAKASWANAK